MFFGGKGARGGREGRKLGRLGRAFGIGRQPAHAIIVADHDLKAPPAVIERRGELPPPLGRHGIGVEQAEGVELPAGDVRSEEHTSELQSLMRISYAVFCLKKKINKRKETNN